MGRRAAWRVRGILVSLLAIGAFGAASNEPKPLVIGPRPVELEVVDTWDALMKTEPVTVDGVQLHLGIQSKECAAGSGILVYCAAEKDVGELYPRKAMQIDGESLGPLSVEIASKRVKIAADRQEKLLARMVRKGPVMFVAAARPIVDGPFEVRVFTADRALIAKREIKTAKGEDQGWRSLTENAGKGEQRATYAMSGESVVPHWEDVGPLAQIKNLPRFLPQESDPSLDVAMKKGLVTVKSTLHVEEEVAENWAIRWWVNGKLTTPAVDREEMLRDGGGARKDRPKLPMEFTFRLQLDPKTLQARPGDIIEFQLLYSAGEFDSADARMMKRALQIDEDTGVRMSKKVRWNP